MPVKSKPILLFVLFSAILLYVAGVATGWYIGQGYYRSAEDRITGLQSDLQGLRSMMGQPSACSYATARYDAALSTLDYFWQGLPYRLESSDVSKDVLNQYVNVETEAYVTGQMMSESCGTSQKFIMYFFDRTKPESTDAGMMLDTARGDSVVLAFPTDIGSPVVTSLLKELDIAALPAAHACGHTIYWPFNATAITEAIKAC